MVALQTQMQTRTHAHTHTHIHTYTHTSTHTTHIHTHTHTNIHTNTDTDIDTDTYNRHTGQTTSDYLIPHYSHLQCFNSSKICLKDKSLLWSVQVCLSSSR